MVMGRTLAPFWDPPPGWERITFRKQGRRWFLYNSVDGQHTKAALREVFKVEAEKRGEDAAKAQEDYDAYLAAEAVARQAARTRFRAAFGDIGTYAEHLKVKGWQVWRERRGRVLRRYFVSPDGTGFTNPVEVEAWFGRQMELGVDVAAIIDSARDSIRRADEARDSLAMKRLDLNISLPKIWHDIQRRRREGAAGRMRWVLPRSASADEKTVLKARLKRWRALTFGHRRRALLDPLRGREGCADARLARLLARRSVYAGQFAEVPVACGIPPGSEEESWVLGHPLWSKIARRGYPLPISEREILALRAYTPREHGGSADVRYIR